MNPIPKMKKNVNDNVSKLMKHSRDAFLLQLTSALFSCVDLFWNTSCYLVNGCLLCTLHSPRHDTPVWVFFHRASWLLFIGEAVQGNTVITTGLLSYLTPLMQLVIDYQLIAGCKWLDFWNVIVVKHLLVFTCLRSLARSLDHRQDAAVLSLTLDSYSYWEEKKHFCLKLYHK